MYYSSNIEHLAIASAGFFVFLASLPFRERNNFIRFKLKTYNCIVFADFQHTNISFSASGLFLKYS